MNKAQYWTNSIAKRADKTQLVLIVGIVLVVILSGLISFNPLIGIAGAFVLFLLVIVVPRPILIVYGLTLVMPLVGGLARGLGIPFLRVGQALLVVGFILFTLAKSSRQGKSRLASIDLAFVLFFLAEAVFPVLALLYRGEHLDLNDTNNIYGVSPLQVLLGPIQYYLLYRIVVATISSERQIKVVLELSFIASIIVSVIGILEKTVAPVKTFIETYYPPFSLYAVPDINLRIASTLQNYSGLASYLAFTIIVVLACYADQKRLKISSLLLTCTLLLNSIALVLTGTFAVWIGLAVGAIVVFRVIRSMPKLVIFVLVGIVLAVLIFQPFISARFDEQFGAGAAQGLLPQSLAFRIMLWKEIFLPAIGQHLIFGNGPAPAANALWSTEESEYLRLLLRGGLLYFFSYLLLIGVAIAVCWKQIRSKSEDVCRPVAIALLAILVAISVMNVSGEYFTYVGGTQTLWTLMAIVVANRQFKALSASAASKQIVGSKQQTVSVPFYSSLGIATLTAVGGSVTERYLVREKNAASSYSQVSHFNALEMSKPRRLLRLFTWLKRLLDWHFVKDSIVVGAGSTISRVLGLLFATLLAHFLTPDDFGFFRYSITLATIITIASAASPVSIGRFLAANPNDDWARDRYFSNGLLGIAFLLAFSLLISVPILWLLHALNLGTIICVVCLAAFYCYLFIVRGIGNAWKIGLTYALSNVALIIALFVVFSLFRLRTTTVALAIYGLTDLVPILVLELFSPMALRFRPNLISKSVLLELARFSMPMVVANGAYTIWNGIDILLVENFNPHVAGSYAAAKTLTLAFIFVPSAITMVLMPKVAALGLGESKRYTAGTVLVSLLISLIGLLIVGLWGHELIDLTFGQSYSVAYSPLLVLAVGMSFYSVYLILEGFIIGRGQPNLPIWALVVALVSTGATGFWLTSWFGALGASLSFTIGAAFGTGVMFFNTWLFLSKEKQKASSQPSSDKQYLSKTN